MRLGQRITSLVLTAVTILTMIVVPMTPAYASGGVGDGLGNTSATGGSSSGTWAASRTGIRVYVVDETGALMSNIVDIVSNTTFPSFDVVACFGTRGIGTHQYYLKDNFGIGAYSSTANIVGGKYTDVKIVPDSMVGLGDLLPIQTFSKTAKKFTTHGETLRKAMLGSGSEGDVWNPGTSVQGGGSGSATTDNTVDLGNKIATLKESIENLFNALKAAGNTDEQIRAELGLEIISIMSDLDSSVDDSGNQIFTEAEKKVIVAALEAHRDSLLNSSGSETELEDSSLKASQSSSLFDIVYAAEDAGMAKLYNNGRLIDLMEKNIGDVPLFYFNGASGITELAVNPETGNTSFLKTCADNGFIIFMEPLFYSRLNKLNKEASAYTFYGTVSNYGQFINEQAANGGWSNGDNVGGNLDRALHQSLAWSMYTDHKLDTDKGICIEAGSDHPALNKTLTNGYLANSKWWGFALHYYKFSASNDGPSIPTYDKTIIDPNPTPHKAQDPDPYTGKIPLAQGENPEPSTPDGKGYQETTRRYNIIKEYSIKKLDGTIEHVSTHWSGFNPGIVYVQHEPNYKVVEWYQSANYEYEVTPISEDTTWEEIKATVTPTAGTDFTFEWDDVSEAKAGETIGKADLGDNCKHYDEATQKPEDGTHYNDTTVVVRLMLVEEPIETHTFDDPESPGPAPDPRDPDEGGPLTPSEEEQLKFHIVKVYETMDEEGQITTDGVFDRPSTAGIITIEDEKDEPAKYELIDWHYSTQYKYPNDWNDALSVSPIINSGKAPTKVDIRNPNNIYEERTLYVRLQRQESEDLVPGDIMIQQSQISKAIHTDDKVIGGRWGNYSFVPTIGDFTKYHITYYDHGCCGGCDPSCGSCHGHTCYLEMPGRSGDNKLTFVFDQIGAEVSLQVKTGVHSNTDPKVYTPNGVHPKTIPGMTAAENVNEFVSDGNQKNGAELVTVLWRGGATPTDIPTLALYKKADIENRYSVDNYEIPQAMLKNASNTSKKTRADGPSVYSLSIRFGIDQGASDLEGTASCVTHNGNQCIYTDTRRVYMIAGTEFDYEFAAQVGVQFYAGAPKGLAAAPFGGPSSSVIKKSTGVHFENNIIQGKQTIKFFPYIRMTYMTNSLKLAELEEQNKDTYVQETRYETYVLSEWESSILPSDAVEVGWSNGSEKESILMTSQQWSLHQKAVNGGQSWNGTNQVLPGGAIYQLSTPNGRHTNVKIVTYQTVVDQKTRQYLSQALTGTEYTEQQVAKDHTDFVNDAKEVLDNLRIVQWVRKFTESEWAKYNSTNMPNAWNNNWDEIPGSGALCVRGGGQSLSELGLTGKSSTEAKYYMHKAGNLISYQSAELGDKTVDLIGDNETASEGDLDIISINQVTTVFKVFTDTAGNVYMASVQQNGTDNEAIITSLVNQLKDVNADTVAMGQTGGASISVLANKTVTGAAINGVLSGDAKQIDDRTSFITNIVSSLTRNKGKDKTAAWSTSDGKWYNEAFDGIYLVRQAATLEIGLAYSSQRTSALDPALCPPNAGQSDLYSKAFLSQFCLNDESDAAIAADKDERYLGTFKGKDITLPDMEGMYQSRKFYIPNANVQDLN